jgi:hypothetical protein
LCKTRAARLDDWKQQDLGLEHYRKGNKEISIKEFTQGSKIYLVLLAIKEQGFGKLEFEWAVAKCLSN